MMRIKKEDGDNIIEIYGNDADEANLPTTFPCRIDSRNFDYLGTGSTFINVSNKKAKMYDEDNNSWN